MKTTKIISVAVAMLALVSCGETSNDAEKGENDKSPANVIAFPDGFSNVAYKCNGPDMVYSSTNGANTDQSASRAAIFVRADDPRCLSKWKDGGLK